MLLAIDIGNTNISYGLFQNNALLKQGKVPVCSGKYVDSLRHLPLKEMEAVIISSVVPRVLTRLRRELRKELKAPLFILGENLTVPIANRYKRPREVGQDRLVNAYAGYKLYGGGLIIVDFGTAVTFDLVSRKGEYWGGIIFPGLRTSLEALCQRAALLPKKMKLISPRHLIGQSTAESIRSGIYYGFASLTNCMVNRIKRERKKNLKIIITGGDAREIYPFLGDIGILKPDLTLIGLMLTYLSERKNEK